MPTRPIYNVIQDRPILALTPDASVLDAAKQMKLARMGAVMVLEGERLIGIFTERDALFRVLAEGRDPARTPLREVMSAEPVTIEADKPFGHALHMMFDHGFRHVPVTERGRVIGMVSARDALGLEVAQFERELRQREQITEILG